MLKPLVPKFRFDLFVCLRDIAEKTGPRKAQTDSSALTDLLWHTVRCTSLRGFYPGETSCFVQE